MNKKYQTATVLSITHWNESLFSFRTHRHQSLKFRNGEFIMIGLEGVEGNTKPLMRAYSIASANHEDFLEFFSIKVPNGAFTSRLQHIKIGDEVLIGSKPTGTLVIDDLKKGRHLFLIGTGTGLAPFLSMIKDPETYERFDRVILFHGVRKINELAYYSMLTQDLQKDIYLGDIIRQQLLYYPCVTRENYHYQGRITDLLLSGKLCMDLDLALIDPIFDRVMLCGSPSMLTDTCDVLDSMGFKENRKKGIQGDYVIERAFVE
jgi:ferredoxin--NADP+ reductase